MVPGMWARIGQVSMVSCMILELHLYGEYQLTFKQKKWFLDIDVAVMSMELLVKDLGRFSRVCIKLCFNNV